MVKKYWHYLFPVLIAGMMVFIFCMSAQPADDSSLTSFRVCGFLARHIIHGFRDFHADQQYAIIDGMSFFVRKMAHFSEYAMLAFLCYIWLHRIRRGALYSFCAVALYASTDEFHQLFVAGRSGSIRDVLIDSSGALCGIFAAFVVISVVYCLVHKEVVEKGMWK